MGEFLRNLFASDLMPHGRCWAWEPWVVWSNVVPDAVIALSYFAISLTLLHVVRRRRDVALHWVASLFGAFIFACGITHAMEVYNTWHGVFRLAGALKGLTALLSLATAALLAAMAPKLEKVPGLDQAIQMKNTLTTERGERRVAERQLQESQERLRLLIEGVKEYALFMIDPQGLVEAKYVEILRRWQKN